MTGPTSPPSSYGDAEPGAPTRIDRANLPAYATGAGLLATGAAESAFALVRDWAHDVLATGVTLITPADLPPDALCVVVTLVGSTTALAEQLPTGDEPVRAIHALERRTGTPAAAVAALNLAAENAILPLIAAAQLGLPLVDGDGTGRVFPLVEQTTYTLAGLSPAPLALAGAAGDLVLLETSRVEATLRPVVLSMGGWAVAACYPMRADDLTGALVPGTVSRLLHAGDHTATDVDAATNQPDQPDRVGEPDRADRAHHTPRADRSLAAPYGVSRLAVGVITAVDGVYHHTLDAPATGLPSLPSSVVVRESDGLRRQIRLEAHNEFVLALADGALAATAPDQICLVSLADGRVIDVDRAEPGMEVEVLVVRAAPMWHTEQGRALGGLPAFGITL